MENISKINSLEVNNIPQNTSIQREPIMEGELTGYASIDKPWMKYYPDSLLLRQSAKKYTRIIDKIKDAWADPNEVIINYYDTEIRAGDFFKRVDEVAKSLVALGVKKGDSIVASLESVPEYIELLLACELIGCSIKDYLGSVDSIINLINTDNSVSYYIAPDYLSTFDSNEIYAKTNVKRIITVNPLFSVYDRSKMRSNIMEVINSKYSGIKIGNIKNMSWNEFLEIGRGIDCFEENNENSIRLFSAFTSGSTGEPKEVMHSSESVLGIVNQMSMMPPNHENRDLWLHTIIPPIIVSVIVAAMCYPLADGKELILDPYCKLEDLDIEMMHFKPSGWALVPLFFNVLLESNRIPKDYDMSHFKLFGFGAEPLTKKYIEKGQLFLNQHNCKVPLSAGYGQSEGGSGFTVAFGKDMIMSGSSGIPYIDTTISIFEPNTTNELKYYEIGEVCKSGLGIMIGYSDKKLTDKVLKIHPDGKLWLHTGDTGYITEQGLLFVLGRKGIRVYPDKTVFPIEIENKVTSIEGVKDAVIVSGKDINNVEFEVPYLFIIPEKNISVVELLSRVNSLIDEELLSEQKPKDIFVIDEKPIDKFKVDRKILQKNTILFKYTLTCVSKPASSALQTTPQTGRQVLRSFGG